MELELTTLLMLGGLALLAGFIDTLAGGGGLLTLPGLLLDGLSAARSAPWPESSAAAGHRRRLCRT